MVPQYKGARPWRDYLYGEGSYIILSFVAKAILSWIVFVGIFTPGSQFLSLKPPKKKRAGLLLKRKGDGTIAEAG